MMSGNIRQLRVIAEGLGDLCNDVVFVGGAVAELYADDPAATDIRPTMDVDCVIELATYGSLQDFEQMLRNRKFVNDIESGVICRWKYNGEIVDIMPDSDSILGFTNRWYRPGFQHRQKILVGDMSIFILSPLYYVATKIEAVRGRGGDDLRFSHDFEDLVYVLNNRQDITLLFDNENDGELTEYLQTWAEEMLLRQNCREEIECMLPYGDYERVDYILEILNYFSR
ncbi:MAG: hypothetical protein K2I45_02650 [Muribaculaceae bacterium]|nr:hypothetical protein [Muribaculaceae bacterium]